jgi:hypothetical protein
MRNLITVEMRDDQGLVLRDRVAERTLAFTIIAVAVAFGLVALPAPDRNWGGIAAPAVPAPADRSRRSGSAGRGRPAPRPDQVPRARSAPAHERRRPRSFGGLAHLAFSGSLAGTRQTW